MPTTRARPPARLLCGAGPGAAVSIPYLRGDGLLDVQGQQQLAVELEGAADEVPGLTLEGVRRGLEVAGVDVDHVGDRVDQQAHGLAVQAHDDDDGVGALWPRRAA